MVRLATKDNKIKRDKAEPGSTVSYYSEKLKAVRKGKTGVKTPWYNAEFRSMSSSIVPIMFFDRKKSRYDITDKNASLNALKSLFDTSCRLQMLAAKSDCPQSEQEVLDMPCWVGTCVEVSQRLIRDGWKSYGMKDAVDSDILSALVPLFELSKGQFKTTSNMVCRKKVFFNGEPYIGGNFDIGFRTRTPFDVGPPVYLDKRDMLGLGKRMGYLLVGDCLSMEELKSSKNLSAKISPKGNPHKLLPFILLVCCQFKINTKESEFKTSKMQEKWSNWGADTRVEIDEMISGVMIPFLQDLRKSFVECVDPRKVDATVLFDRILWEEWPLLASRYKSCRSEDLSFSGSNLNEEDSAKTLNFQYAVIMAISQESADRKTKRVFNSLVEGAHTPLDFLMPLKELELTEFLEVLCEIAREASLAASRILPVIELAVTSIVLFGGDVGRMSSIEMRAITQISWKKQAITQNVIASTQIGKEMSGYTQVGGDVHVKRVIAAMVQRAKWVKMTSNWTADHDLYVLHNIGAEVGYYTNELLAQFGQLINGTQEMKDLTVRIKLSMGKKNEEYKAIFSKWEEMIGKNRSSVIGQY